VKLSDFLKREEVKQKLLENTKKVNGLVSNYLGASNPNATNNSK
jgi:hypothetical protein